MATSRSTGVAIPPSARAISSSSSATTRIAPPTGLRPSASPPSTSRAAAARPCASKRPRRTGSQLKMTSDGPQRRGFSHVEIWVFDLDNTLYPHHVNLWQQVDERIRDYIAGFLKIPREAAFRVQKDYYKRYGTSMRGLMIEHGMQPDDFLDYVHQIDHSPLTPNAALGAAIEVL